MNASAADEPGRWLDELTEVDVDVTYDGRRVVRGDVAH